MVRTAWKWNEEGTKGRRGVTVESETTWRHRNLLDLESLTAAEQAEIFDLTRLSVSLLRSAYRPDGYNIGMNLGRVAGAGVADHLHMHVVPRWNGDTNFMPVIAETKVLSESLTDTWRKLREALRAREGDTSGGGRAP